jgi:hypothetical protein
MWMSGVATSSSDEPISMASVASPRQSFYVSGRDVHATLLLESDEVHMSAVVLQVA